MSDENTTPQSGSRWEPRNDDAGAPTPAPVPPSEARRTALPPAGLGSAATSGPRSWASRAGSRGGLLAGALALVLAAGAGGFAVSEIAQRPDAGRLPFGVSSQPQDAGFPAPAPGFGDDEGSGDDGDRGDAGQLGGQFGGGESDDGGSQSGSSL